MTQGTKPCTVCHIAHKCEESCIRYKQYRYGADKAQHMMTPLDRAVTRLPHGPWNLSSHRSCAEKELALCLVLGGVQTCRPTVSYYCGHPDEYEGLMVNRVSIEARPGVLWCGEHLLYECLDRCGVRYSGAASDQHMQASWLPGQQDEYSQARTINPLLICCYFDAIKELKDRGKLKYE